MSDTETTPPAKEKKITKSTSVSHPPYHQMITEAITALQEKGGSSRQAIIKYIIENYKIDADSVSGAPLKLALKRGVANGLLKQSKGTGASGSFKLGEKQNEKTNSKNPTVVKLKNPKNTKPKIPSAKKAKKPKIANSANSPKKVKIPAPRTAEKTADPNATIQPTKKVHFLMAEDTEQRVCIKFCQQLGKTGSETFQMLKEAYGPAAMSRARVFDWYRRFKEGRTSVESDERTGRPSTSRNNEIVEKVRSLVRADRSLTIRELSGEVGISFGSCQAILTVDLGMRRCSQVCSTSMSTPSPLPSPSIDGRADDFLMATATDLLQCAETDV